MVIEYPPATLRVAPHAIPTVRAAIDETINELAAHLSRMRDGALIPEPWLGDSASRYVQQIYNEKVMRAPDGPYMAMWAYVDRLQSARDELARAEAEYRRTEGDNAELWGRA